MRKIILNIFIFLLITTVIFCGRKDPEEKSSFSNANLLQHQYTQKPIGRCTTGNCTNGSGTFIQPDGSKYTGEFKNNEPHGKGKAIFSNGDTYEGEFKNNKMDGKGTYIFGINSQWSGDKYEGYWKNDFMHGKGTYTFGPKSQFRGDKFIGMYKYGKKNGKGTYVWANGNKYVKYVGDWMNDNMHGYGILYKSDGTKIEGKWKNDNYIGR